MKALPSMLVAAILCQAIAPQLSRADVKDIDSSDALNVSASVRAELNSIENATAVPGSKEELAQRLSSAPTDLRPLSIFKTKQLPPEPPEDHATNSVVHVPPIRAGRANLAGSDERAGARCAVQRAHDFEGSAQSSFLSQHADQDLL